MIEKLGLEWEPIRAFLLTGGVRILIILVVSAIAYQAVRIVTGRMRMAVEDDDPTTMNELEKRAETLTRIVRQVTLVLVWLVAGMLIMKELGFDAAPLLAGAGIVGLAVGFGAQNLVRDVITGYFILLENQMRVGDVVEIGGKSGLVEGINLRTTVLRDAAGDVHIVPNGEIKAVTNRTMSWSRFVLDVGVAYKEDVDRVMEALAEIGATMEKDPAWEKHILEPLTVLGVNAFGASSVDIRVSFKTVPQQQWAVGRELRRRIKNRFDELGIEIPFPHVTLYVGEGAQGVLRQETVSGPGAEASARESGPA